MPLLQLQGSVRGVRGGPAVLEANQQQCCNVKRRLHAPDARSLCSAVEGRACALTCAPHSAPPPWQEAHDETLLCLLWGNAWGVREGLRGMDNALTVELFCASFRPSFLWTCSKQHVPIGVVFACVQC
jgi:hypothetical protein